MAKNSKNCISRELLVYLFIILPSTTVLQQYCLFGIKIQYIQIFFITKQWKNGIGKIKLQRSSGNSMYRVPE